MEKLKDSWTFALRIFYQFLQATACFEDNNHVQIIENEKDKI